MENSSKSSPAPDGYLTLDEVQEILGTCRATTLSYVKSLSSDLYDTQKLDNGIVFRYIVKKDALNDLKSFNSILPIGLVSASEIYESLNIPSQVFFTYVKRQGFYDKAIKQGRRNKKYHRIYFTKQDADEILNLYKSRTLFKNKYLLTNYIPNKFINDDFILFLNQYIEIVKEDDQFYVCGNHAVSKLIRQYFNSIGFITTRQACDILKISRQALHQNMKKNTDQSICLNISVNTRPENYLLKDFVLQMEKKNRCETNDVPNGFLAITYLSKQFNISHDQLLNLLTDSNVNYVTVKGRKLYNIAESINIAKNYIKINQENIKIEDWLNLTYFAKKIGLLNQDVLLKIKEKGLHNSQYIKTRNGKAFGKHFLLNPELFNLLIN